MKYILIIGFTALCLASGVRGGQAPAQRPYQFSVGFGWGSEAGKGIQLGLISGPHTLRTGLGFLINGEEDAAFYSGGLRYGRRLFRGHFNDTYAWTGTGAWAKTREGETDYLMSLGLGLGLSYHLGLPVHLDADAGYRLYYDSRDNPAGTQWGLTGNLAITYNW